MCNVPEDQQTSENYEALVTREIDQKLRLITQGEMFNLMITDNLAVDDYFPDY